MSGGREESAAGESSKPPTAASSGTLRPAGPRASRTPWAIRSEATRPRRCPGHAPGAGRAARSPLAARPAVVAGGDQRVVGGQAVLCQRLAVSGETLDAARGVQGAGDGGDPTVPRLVQGAPCPGRRPGRPPRRSRSWRSGACRRPRPGRPPRAAGRPRVAELAGNQQDSVDVAGLDVTQIAPSFVLGSLDHQQQRDVLRGERLRTGPQQHIEVRVLEAPFLRLGQQERHRVGPTGDQRAGVPVHDVTRPADRGVDGRLGGGADVVPAVEDARDRAARAARRRRSHVHLRLDGAARAG